MQKLMIGELRDDGVWNVFQEEKNRLDTKWANDSHHDNLHEWYLPCYTLCALPQVGAELTCSSCLSPAKIPVGLPCCLRTCCRRCAFMVRTGIYLKIVNRLSLAGILYFSVS